MTTPTANGLDQTKVDACGERIAGILNGGGLSLMISLGHRAGLFDAMADLPPATSDAIARAASLNERYVREWLGAMVTGELVEFDAVLGTYHLPAEHAACLTRAASPSNMAVTTQFISVLAGVEDRILECFREGGGVPYSAYPRFHEVMAEESDQTVLACLESGILPLVPGLPERLEQGIDVLDVGCGSGRAMLQLARRFPASRFTGYDISDEATGAARATVEREGLSNVSFEVRDVSELVGSNRFGLVTAFDAIHDQARPDRVLEGISNSLAEGGVFLMQDIHASSHVHGNLDHPIGPLLYAISCMHCMTVSLADDGAGLGAVWGREKALEMLDDAGFRQVVVHQLPHDEINCYYVAWKR